jgi:hypothetical protein
VLRDRLVGQPRRIGELCQMGTGRRRDGCNCDDIERDVLLVEGDRQPSADEK